MNAMLDEWIVALAREVKSGRTVERAEAQRLLELTPQSFHVLLYAACDLRRHFRDNSLKTCAIVNAKSGFCHEDCSFCAQSVHHDTGIETYALMGARDMLARAQKEEGHSKRFGIVTAGKDLAEEEVNTVREAIAGFRKHGLEQLPCASLGTLGEDSFRALRQAGLTRYHHNLETSRNFYPRICSTHTYEERVQTIQAARNAGLEICVGGIWGIGESDQDRIDLLYEIAALKPNSVPINFLVPIPGTPLQDLAQMSLWDAVKIVALARFVMPDTDIKIGAGRLEVFRDAQPLVFLAGANGIIVGHLLTVKGRPLEDDLRLIEDLGLRVSD